MKRWVFKMYVLEIGKNKKMRFKDPERVIETAFLFKDFEKKKVKIIIL